MPRLTRNKVRIWPEDGNTVGWDKILPGRPPAVPLRQDIAAEWTVIGAGFTGLACARRLAELHPDDRIVLIDALRVGQGNSGRNSGFLLYGSPARDDLSTVVGAARDRVQKAGLHLLERLVREHDIQCDWDPGGMCYSAMSETEVGLLKKLETQYAASKEPFELWSPEKVHNRFGIRKNCGALFYPKNVMVNPAALVRGLAETLPKNVEIYENSPLVEIRKDEGWIVKTPSGAIRSDNVMLCMNAFTPELLGNQNQFVSIGVFAVMSRKLTEAELSLLGTGPFGFLSPLMGDSLFRRTFDGRLMCRQNWNAYLPGRQVTPDLFPTIVRHARESIRIRWPELENLDFEDIWGGGLAMTGNNGHVFGKVEDGLYVSSFCNGGHNTRGSMTGHLLADFASGHKSPLLADQLKLPAPTRLPPAFITGAVARYRVLQARRAQRRAQKHLL